LLGEELDNFFVRFWAGFVAGVEVLEGSHDWDVDFLDALVDIVLHTLLADDLIDNVEDNETSEERS